MGMFDKNRKPQSNQSNGDDPFSRIGGSDVRKGGTYPVPGVYPILLVDVVKLITSRKGEDIFIAEFEILESNVDERPTGTRMSWAANLKHDPSPGNIKAFLAAAGDVDPEEVNSEAAQLACSEDNPLHGRLVRLEATITTTKSGNAFTLCDFRPLPEKVQAQADKLREKAGFVTPF